MKNSLLKRSASHLLRRKPHQVLPTLIVSGACVLSPMTASGIELGEVAVTSSLGQPLRASISYALNANEQLFDYCIYLRPAAANSAMPTVSRAMVSVTGKQILFTGNTPIKEPLLSMQVAVDCPYTPNLVREYTLMIDPARPAEEAKTIAVQEIATPVTVRGTDILRTPRQAPATAVSGNPAARPQQQRTSTSLTPIKMNDNYVVQPGDTVSTIVSRVEGRTVRLWPAVNAVFAANPDAFLGNDVNRLLAGAVLYVPKLDMNEPVRPIIADTGSRATAPATASVVPPAAARPAQQLPTEPEASRAATTTLAPTAEPAQTGSVSMAQGEVFPTVVAETAPAASTTTRTAVSTGEPVVTGQAPGSAGASATTRETDQFATDAGGGWLAWLGGIGLALFLGLLLFGRMIRNRFGPDAEGAELAPGRRHDDDPTQRNPIIEEVDFDFEDTINSRAFSLDADLEAGTGLKETADMHVAQDFSFSTGEESASVDVGVADGDAASIPSATTDVIAPHLRVEPATILESEEPPAGDYDMSMIVDATKQTLGDYDDTAKDLQAIQIDAEDDDYTLSGGTLTSEMDFKILEQDYEDELTATQILNQQVEKAARELANRMDDNSSDDDTTSLPEIDLTSEGPSRHLAAPTAEDDATAVLPESFVKSAAGPTRGFELPTVSDTGITAELTNTHIPSDFEAQNDDLVVEDSMEITREMAASGSDVTVEPKRIDGKKS